MSGAHIYCVDASSLIDGYLDVYPSNIFIGLWPKIENLVDQGRFVAPEEIFDELIDQQDDLSAWVTTHKRMFLQMGSPEDQILRQMVSDFPQLADPIRSKACASSADQILVAMAHARGFVVVSEEAQGSHRNRRFPSFAVTLG